MEYQIQITESLQRITSVSAASENEAVELVRRCYRDEEIILGSEDFVTVDFTVQNSKNIGTNVSRKKT